MTIDYLSGPVWPGQCFGCSPRNPHGLQLRFRKTPSGCMTTHVLAAHHCGVEGIAHGGIVSTLLDETAAWALILHTGRLGLTSEMSIKFVSPVKTGASLNLEAGILSQDGKRAATQARIVDANGANLAVADAQWVLASPGVVARMSGLSRAEVDSFFDTVKRIPEP